MTPEQRSVHRRLLATLQVRTHSSKDDDDQAIDRGHGYEHGKHPKKRKAVIVFGKRYESINAAAQATGRSRQLIYQWVMRGKDCSYAE